jgi:hypothetical protein
VEQQHTIGRLELSHQLPPGEYAPAVRETTARICRDHLVPALNNLLNSWTDPGEVVRIDRIEILVRARSVDHLEQILVESVLKKIGELYNPSTIADKQRNAIQKIPRATANFYNWIYFLQHGSLPYTSSLHEQGSWESDILETLATQIPAKHACRDVLIKYPQAVTRILSQFGGKFIQLWAAAYAGMSSQQMVGLVQDWKDIFGRQEFREFAYKLSWSSTVLQNQSERWLIYRIIMQPEQPDADTQLMDLAAFCFVKKDLPILFSALEDFLAEHKNTGQVLKVYLAEWRKKNPVNEKQPGRENPAANIPEIPTIKRPVTEDEGTGLPTTGSSTEFKSEEMQLQMSEDVESSSSSDMLADIDRVKPSNDLTSSIAIKENQPADNEEAADLREKQHYNEDYNNDHDRNEEISDQFDDTDQDSYPEPAIQYIKNSGLVLIHPYLFSLFEAQGLMKRNKFKNRFCQDKAVQYLCYLAHGETGLPEYDLILPKLMCGLSPAEPVSRFITLDEEERAEAESLLKAMISHWNALGNTSPDGLRTNFLQREGRLQWKSSEWRLRVTQLTHDILLDKLPWSISIIRLPWMPFFLKTEWT